EPDDRLFLPLLQPEIPGNPAVVLVHLAVAFPPVVELADGDVEPPNKPPGADLGLLRPTPDEIHDLIPRIVRDPGPGQSSPMSFFSATCSAMSSAKTSSFVWIFFCKYASAPGRRNGWSAASARRPQPRSRRIPSASGRRPSAGVPLHRTTSRWAPSPANAASGWRPSLPARIASVASSCVLSNSLIGERLLHFQLNRNSIDIRFIKASVLHAVLSETIQAGQDWHDSFATEPINAPEQEYVELTFRGSVHHVPESGRSDLAPDSWSMYSAVMRQPWDFANFLSCRSWTSGS